MKQNNKNVKVPAQQKKGNGKPKRRFNKMERTRVSETFGADEKRKLMEKRMDLTKPVKVGTKNLEHFGPRGKKIRDLGHVDLSRIVKTDEVYRVDARNPLQTFAFNDGDKIASQSSSTIVSPGLLYQSLAATILPVLTTAIQSGFEQYANAKGTPSTPYLAYIYMIQILENYVQNNTPLAITVPKWLAFIGNALKPKNVTFKSGSLEYSWQYQPDITFPSVIPLGSSAGPVQVNYMIRVPTTITDPMTGYPTMTTPVVYTQPLGQAAFAILCNYFNDKERLHPMWKMIPFSAGGEFNRDSSAFAYPSQVLGVGSGSGNWLGFIGNEVPITHPLLGCYTASSQLVRAPKHYRNVTTDPSIVAGLLHDFPFHQILRMKNQIVLKAVDFFEFVDVISLWVQKLFQFQANSNVVNNMVPNLGITWANYLVMLRSFFILAFGSTQRMVQGLWPRVPTGTADHVFSAFAVGTNCYPCDDTSALSLPTPLIENVRCLGSRATYFGFNPKTGKEDANNPLLYIPVLGAYGGITYNAAVYNYNAPGNVSTSIFTDITPPSMSLFDGTRGTTVLQISQSGIVTQSVATFNNAIKSLNTYSCALTTLGESGGINALEVITMTNVNTPLTNLNERKGDSEMTNRYIQRSKMTQVEQQNFQLGPYDNNSILAVTSQTPIRRSVWTGVQKYWIKPCFVGKIGNSNTDNTDLYTIATYGDEPYNMSFNINNSINAINTTSTSTVHDQYASLMVKAAFAKEPEICDLLLEWAKEGRGGILSGIVSALASILPI